MEKIIICNSIHEAIYFYNEFVKIMSKCDELSGTRGNGLVVYLKTGEKYMFVNLDEQYRFASFRGKKVSGHVFETALDIYKMRHTSHA